MSPLHAILMAPDMNTALPTRRHVGREAIVIVGAALRMILMGCRTCLMRPISPTLGESGDGVKAPQSAP